MAFCSLHSDRSCASYIRIIVDKLPAENKALYLLLVVVDIAAVAEPHVNVSKPCHHHLVAKVACAFQASQSHDARNARLELKVQVYTIMHCTWLHSCLSVPSGYQEFAGLSPACHVLCLDAGVALAKQPFCYPCKQACDEAPGSLPLLFLARLCKEIVLHSDSEIACKCTYKVQYPTV